MILKSAKDVIAVANSRGMSVHVDPGPPPMPYLRKPANVPNEEVTDTLIAALKAWRNEIIEELSHSPPVGQP